jgi:D-arabinose 1-dehydrogenase-like Zn-dependent alcohol dehydrogenase
MSKETMKAVVFHGKLDVRLEDRPIPQIVDPTDIIVKVRYSALCGRYVIPLSYLSHSTDDPA